MQRACSLKGRDQVFTLICNGTPTQNLTVGSKFYMLPSGSDWPSPNTACEYNIQHENKSDTKSDLASSQGFILFNC